MFKQNTIDNINGWGSIFRFLTPLALTVGIFILTGLKEDIKETKVEIKFVRTEQRKVADDLITYTLNHLEHHRVLEVRLTEDMTAIKGELQRIK